MEAALQETLRVDADSHEDGEIDMEIDIEDIYAPDPAQLAPKSPDIGIVQNNSTIPGGKATVDDQEASSSQLPNAHKVPEIENEDDYEPPEATPPDLLESPPFSPAPPESLADGEEFIYDTPALGHPSQENHPVEKKDSMKQVNGSVPHWNEVIHPYGFLVRSANVCIGRYGEL